MNPIEMDNYFDNMNSEELNVIMKSTRVPTSYLNGREYSDSALSSTMYKKYYRRIPWKLDEVDLNSSWEDDILGIPGVQLKAKKLKANRSKGGLRLETE